MTRSSLHYHPESRVVEGCPARDAARHWRLDECSQQEERGSVDRGDGDVIADELMG